jgi:hypothetical protein
MKLEHRYIMQPTRVEAVMPRVGLWRRLWNWLSRTEVEPEVKVTQQQSVHDANCPRCMLEKRTAARRKK